MTDSFKARTTLTVGAQQYDILSLAALKSLNVDRLPFSLKILLENLLRFEDGVNVNEERTLMHCSNGTRRRLRAMRSLSPRRGSSCRTSPACRAS